MTTADSSTTRPVVGVVMGSDSDWPVMEAAAQALEGFGVPYEADVVSAHRMPAEMIAYGQGAADRGLRVIVAGAGGAAHLPGMLASVTVLPVIGVPLPLLSAGGSALITTLLGLGMVLAFARAEPGAAEALTVRRGALRRSLGWLWAAVVTGGIFGAIHVAGTAVVFLLPLAVLGFLLCWLYRKTGSLLPGMAVHAFNNAWALGSTLGWAAGAQVAVVVAAPLVVVALVSLVAVPQRPRFLPPIAPR